MGGRRPGNSVVTDGNTLWMGGSFSYVGPGVSGGAVDANFNPAPDGIVYDLKLVNNRLYVAGSFYSIGGVNNRYAIACLNAQTGVRLIDKEPQLVSSTNIYAIEGVFTPTVTRTVTLTGTELPTPTPLHPVTTTWS